MATSIGEGWKWWGSVLKRGKNVCISNLISTSINLIGFNSNAHKTQKQKHHHHYLLVFLLVWHYIHRLI